MTTRQIAIVPEGSITGPQLAVLSAALQKQAARDLRRAWNVDATVDVFFRREDVPAGYWPIVIVDRLDDPNQAGTHADTNWQPIAIVEFAGRDWDEFTTTVSHECMEMLIDPWGNWLIPGPSLKEDQTRVEYLVEVCDPCQSSSYSVNGVQVADFVTQAYFEPVVDPGVRYSHAGSVSGPRHIAQGGHLNWMDTVTGEWWRASRVGTKLAFRPLGRLPYGTRNLRTHVDHVGGYPRRRGTTNGKSGDKRRPTAAEVGMTPSAAASVARARAWERQFRFLEGRSSKEIDD